MIFFDTIDHHGNLQQLFYPCDLGGTAADFFKKNKLNQAT